MIQKAGFNEPRVSSTSLTPPGGPRNGGAPRWYWISIALNVLMLTLWAGLGYHAIGLQEQLTDKQADLRARTTQLSLATKSLKTGDRERDKAHHQHEKARERIAELSVMLDSNKSRLFEVVSEQRQAEEALEAFKAFTAKFRDMIDAGHLETTFRRGRMIVNLPEKVLFPSGSAELTKGGARALGQVAEILKEVKNPRFIVAGHTDNEQVKKSAYPSNWALSAARAVTVTEALIAAGMSPKRLVAAGYSEFDPVAGNKSVKGRGKNRRIEIVLEPHIDKLPRSESKKVEKKTRAKKSRSKRSRRSRSSKKR
jgi:chemotaxis protein MotB